MTDAAIPATPTRKTPPPTVGGRVFLALLGLSIALLGGVFVWLMARSFMRALDQRSWPEVPCVILVSEVEERQHDENSAPEYRQNISFGYEWQGKPQTGDHISLRGNPWTSKRELADARAEAYPNGSSTVCFVSPKNPEFAVLQKESLAPGYSIWFPSLFVVGGLVMAGRTLRKPR